MTFALALTAAVLSLLSLILHKVAPKTKTTVDDSAVEIIDKVKDALPGGK